MTLFIKNMVCGRCITSVQDIMDRLQIRTVSVTLGEVHLNKPLSQDDLDKFSRELTATGFALIDDRKSRIIEKIKTAIIELVHYSAEQPKVNLSAYIADKLNLEYHYLSHLFSEIEGVTIERYYIGHKIERVKELLVYDELSVSQIADLLGYSSPAHLATQFKKLTGLTPGHFKNIGKEKRKPLDEV